MHKITHIHAWGLDAFPEGAMAAVLLRLKWAMRADV
jgi:hypothetical protein